MLFMMSRCLWCDILTTHSLMIPEHPDVKYYMTLLRIWVFFTRKPVLSDHIRVVVIAHTSICIMLIYSKSIDRIN